MSEGKKTKKKNKTKKKRQKAQWFEKFKSLGVILFNFTRGRKKKRKKRRKKRKKKNPSEAHLLRPADQIMTNSLDSP